LCEFFCFNFCPSGVHLHQCLPFVFGTLHHHSVIIMSVFFFQTLIAISALEGWFVSNWHVKAFHIKMCFQGKFFIFVLKI
jgi:hypothetical protein